MSDPKPDTSNWFLVSGAAGGHVQLIYVGQPLPLTRAQALNLAAWLVAIADPAGRDFEALLKAIRET